MQDYRDRLREVSEEMQRYINLVADLVRAEATKQMMDSVAATQTNTSNTVEAAALESSYLSAAESTIRDYSEKPPASSSGSSGSGSSGGGKSGGYRVGDTVRYRGLYYHDSYGARPAGSKFADQSGVVKIDSYSNKKYGGNASNTGSYAVHINAPSQGYYDLGWINESQLYDTGGYTGDWSEGNPQAKNGKLAWLHQKELVLNDSDTQNILNAVQAVRDMVNGIKQGALNSFTDLFNMNKANFNNKDNPIEQTITIEATFPNANSVQEIQDAILGLANQSTQYVHKTR